jgi:Cu2+-exporting ATPase
MRDTASDTAFGGCCGGGLAAAAEAADAACERWARPERDGAARIDLMVPGVTCAACVRRIETGLAGQPGIRAARVNLSMRRARVLFDPGLASVAAVMERLAQLGFTRPGPSTPRR